MRRRAALVVLGAGGLLLLLTPGAPGVPDIPGDPSPPVVTPVIAGTIGDAGWYTSNVTVNWSVVDPESVILSTVGCDARTLTADTVGTRLACTATSDGGETTVAKTFKLDKTAPAAAATPSRSADANGWYNHALTVDFTGTDATSGLSTCSTAQTYSGPDTGGAAVSGTCRDQAGNIAPASFAVKYDATAPQPSPSVRAPDANGWYNHALTVDFAGTDGTSGVDTCTQVTYAGPDDPSVALSGTCRDLAGNQSSSSVFTFRYDETSPQAAAAPGRPPDLNGWYNHALTVSFTGSDATSGLDSCDAAKTYSGPDDGNASVGGSCRDRAGNAAPRSFAFKYDATPPQPTATPARNPNANGWYNAPVTVAIAGTDAVSGVASCDAAKSYSGPDNATASVSGACLDQAGNVGSTSFALKYDGTAPQSTATPSRQPNANGWYRAALTVTFAATDGTSGIDTCDAAKSYSGPDTGAATLSGSCRDRAGNSGGSSFTLKYDATAPQVSTAARRSADANGWYNAPLTVDFAGGDVTSGLDSCDAAKTYSGPDSAAAAVTGTCFDKAGNLGAASFGLKYDATAPQTTATPSRQANANGWHNAPLTVNFAGTDAVAGIESCDAAKSYSGPDVASTTLTGACRDKAGNASSAALTVKYDATAPSATATPSRQPNANGWYNAPLTVAFAATDATSGLESCPAVRTYSGPDDAAAAVSGTCVDKAGNAGSASFTLRYDGTAPQATATPSRQPNANGWYNAPLTVSFAAADVTSGLDACPVARTYSGPDAAATAVSGTCFDKAGNGGLASFALKYDATAPQATATPSRQPNANGWYNAALTVAFAATDAMSGFDRCDAEKSYAGPDSASAALSGTCQDKAGNVASASLALKYDATAPQTVATPLRSADTNGWYNHALTVGFAGTDATSTVDSCDTAKSYSGPDSTSTSVTGTCLDKAGNVGATSFALKYDGTAPQAVATPSRSADTNGWYNHALTVSFAGTDETAGIDSCDVAKSYSGPDSASTGIGGACRDRAGNSGTGTYALKYDATAPQTTATPSRPANANGWYNAPLTVSFAATDPTSTVDACDAAKNYSGPDVVSTAVGGTCQDKAGNTGNASLPLKYDATAPQTTATPSRQPNANGWYNASLTVGFAATDATSTIDSCDAAKTYSGPDSAAATVSGTCRDKAGNAAGAAVPLKYDATAPQATATPSRQPNANGWYRAPLTVTFTATDALSGLESCPAAQAYAGPDSTAAVVSGTCLDAAGNGALAAFVVRYDQTAPVTSATPSREADHAAWYSAPLSIDFTAADATSGVESCDASQPYNGPDTASVLAAGSCRDRAGNASTNSFAFKYDATPPAVTNAVPTRLPDRAGWYNRPVVVDAQGDDATSGLASCPSVTYTGPDGDDAAIAGSCVDVAGNVGFKWFSIDYDGSGPQVAAAAGRAPDANGWYNRPLTVSFAGSDPVSGLESCAAPERYEGPDSASAVVSGICLDRAGNAGVASFALRFDATAPQVTGATPERAPDSNGWYNHPLAVSFHGSDATSGIDACTKAGYAGPESVAASITGSCLDRAGNGSAAASFGLKYDVTGPSLTGVSAKGGNRTVLISWTASPDTALVEIHRAGRLVYRGLGRSFTDTRLQNGVRYRYVLTGYDEAGNSATSMVAARPTAPLVSPPAGAIVSSPPRLVWSAVDNATHYNVQLWRRGKIFTAWPKGTSIRLRRSWTYAGRRYVLTPGRYRWYVWPGYGGKGSRRYGPLLGSSSFVVRQRSR